MKKTANQLLIKAVPTPPAQYVKPCANLTQALPHMSALLENIFRRNDITQTDKACIELSIMSGSRISALLRLSGNDVLSDGKILIRQDKNSLPITYFPIRSLSFWLNVKNKNISPFYGLSRFYYYRLFLKLGISIKFGNNSTHSVTHLGRHYQGLVHRNIDEKTKLQLNTLGHKNKNNIKNYENEPAKNQLR